MMFSNSKEITIRYGRREFFSNWDGWTYAIRKDEPPTIIDESSPAAVVLYEWWE